MTNTEFKQTVETLLDMLTHIKLNMKDGLKIPASVKDLNINDFDEVGILLYDVREEMEAK